jgi:hypothetical protein
MTVALIAGASASDAQTITCDPGDPSVTLTDDNNKDHTITFCGSAYDAVRNETTFGYKVNEDDGDGLSHWTIGLCAEIGSDEVASWTPKVGTNGVSAVTPVTPANPRLNRIRGIKWDFADGFTTGEFTVVLTGVYGEKAGEVQVKGGGGNKGTIGTLIVPDCDAVCADRSQDPSFDGLVIRDGDRRLVEVLAPRGTTEIEFYSTSPNLVVGGPENESGGPLAFTTSVGPNGGTLFTLAAPTTQVRFPLSSSDPATRQVSFFVKVEDECGAVDVDPQFTLDTAAQVGAVVSAQAGPNPSSGHAVVRYGLAEAGPATVSVYDVLGRQVAVLADGAHSAGAHEAVWDAERDVPAGVYVIRVEAGGGAQVLRMTLVR